MKRIEFFAVGEPKGQPRPRAFARKIGGVFTARVFDAGTAEGWKSCVAIAARPHLPSAPLGGPLHVTLSFFFDHPKSHFRSGKNAGELKDSAPNRHTSKPDLDNAAKAVLDALTILKMWGDDAQIDELVVRKFWNPPGMLDPGVRVIIESDGVA